MIQLKNQLPLQVVQRLRHLQVMTLQKAGQL
ncbi:hypothetical protein JCM5805K_1674 [Lactococcus lactis subsp. lactis]|uniref:Uncharacterized protein n=1 Tax=Lactococcus lactis subsp. lactis TaxID=1360 RepID=A0A0B8R2U9_LACLL|nr:hypothetical protein JCM5805K_1674 [Lactococcus lactis subsp. lactis]